MSEQAIETVAIKWTLVNPMGYLLRAYGQGREFFSDSALFPYPYSLCCFNLGKGWYLPRPVNTQGTLTDDSNTFISPLQPSATSVNT